LGGYRRELKRVHAYHNQKGVLYKSGTAIMNPAQKKFQSKLTIGLLKFKQPNRLNNPFLTNWSVYI